MNIAVVLEKLEALSLREKGLIAMTVSVFLVSVLQFFVVDPKLKAIDQLENQMSGAVSHSQRLELQLDGKLLMPKSNRREVLKQELDVLRTQLETEQTKIQNQTVGLVPAAQIPELLQDLVSREAVELVSLKNLAPNAMLETTDESTSVQLYQHGIELELRGSYHSLRRYLAAVEQQPWKLIWQAVHFETEKDGSSLMRLELQTLSTDDAWLGV